MRAKAMKDSRPKHWKGKIKAGVGWWRGFCNRQSLEGFSNPLLRDVPKCVIDVSIFDQLTGPKLMLGGVVFIQPRREKFA